MTDGDQPRGRRALWAWGVAWAMALASVIYIWSVLNSDPQRADLTTPGTGLTTNDLRALDSYQAFVASSGLRPGPSHEYTASGIEHLAEAIRAVAEAHDVSNATLVEQRHTFRRQADALRVNPRALDHADIVRDVFHSAVDMLEYLQKHRHLDSPGLLERLSNLRQLARSFDASEPLLRQQERIEQFFSGSADALRTLATG